MIQPCLKRDSEYAAAKDARDDGSQTRIQALNEHDLFMPARIHLGQDVHLVDSRSIRRRPTLLPSREWQVPGR
jgi:hypothetical protein